jgi:hypothetical protein
MKDMSAGRHVSRRVPQNLDRSKDNHLMKMMQRQYLEEQMQSKKQGKMA